MQRPNYTEKNLYRRQHTAKVIKVLAASHSGLSLQNKGPIWHSRQRARRWSYHVMGTNVMVFPLILQHYTSH